MQENNFEKQVHKLMDDLQITPGEPVWEYVEKRIPKSNRKRRFIAFFLLFAGLGVCGYFFYDKFSDENKTMTGDKNIIAESKSSSKPGNTNESNTKSDSVVDTITQLQQNNINTNDAKAYSTETQSITNSFKKIERKKEIDNKNVADFSSSISPAENDDTASTFITDKQQNEVSTDNKISEPIATVTNDHAEDTSKAIASLPTPKDSTVATSTDIPKHEQKKKELKKISTDYKKLQLGVTAFYGRSNAVESFTQGIGINDPNKNYAQDLTANPGTNWDSTLSASYSKIVTAKSAYSIGAVVKKQFSPRSSVRTGILYTRINTEIKIGAQKDTSAVLDYNNSGITTRLENYFNPGISGSYTNKYNIIQIPVSYSYQLNKSKSFPLVIDAGFTLSQIFSSDALVYDSYNQAYYKNPSLINKTQVTFSTGFHTAFSFKHGGTIEFGPQLHYGLTNVVKNNSTGQHIFLWGLNATYFLKRK